MATTIVIPGRVQIPPQSATPHDKDKLDSEKQSSLFNVPWYMAFSTMADLINALILNINSGGTSTGDNLVTINGVKVTY